MILLGIETSCDDTAAAVIQNEKTILSSVISSQNDYHKKYGGIVPEIASRKHQENIIPVINEALQQAKTAFDDLEGIAVTQGPGLVGSLLVGINAAKAMAYAGGLPLAGINHLEGHLLAPHFEHDIPFPHISLIVSGGHTSLYFVEAVGAYTLLGKTRDDAAGEAFDKVAKILGLGYPGGILIDRMACSGSADAVSFPRPMIHDGSHDFSFSGLKTAVSYYVQQHSPVHQDAVCDIAAGFQAAVVDILVRKTFQAVHQTEATAVTVGGGVAANSMLRREMQTAADRHSIPVYFPSPALCTDNAAMIALAGHYRIDNGPGFPWSLNAVSRFDL